MANYRDYKSEAIIVAKQLGYGRKVIDQIKEAKSDIQVGNILTTARREKFDGFSATKGSVMTPINFAKKMRSIINDNIDREGHYDCECGHLAMDNLMCDLLRDLGYGDGIDIFEDSGRWYA